jgi:hypothetical protein
LKCTLFERLLSRKVPWWWWRCKYYEDLNIGEIGWKVGFFKYPD